MAADFELSLYENVMKIGKPNEDYVKAIAQDYKANYMPILIDAAITDNESKHAVLKLNKRAKQINL
jgi:hypothetical protein